LIITGAFLGVMVLAWCLEDSRWQISERLGTVLIVLALPVFFVGWKYEFVNLATSGPALAGMLGRLILALSAIKLLQKKSDRDWIFLYLMAFFEVLLGAGLSISALYFGSFLLYLLTTVCAVVAFEIRKTTSTTGEKASVGEHTVNLDKGALLGKVPIGRLPGAAVVLILLIGLLAIPTFFMLPRVGGAGFGGGQSKMPSTGFSSSVRLGDIGRIQQNDQVVMRVRVEDPDDAGSLYWRGIALDRFDGEMWTRTMRDYRERFTKGDKEYIQVDQASGKNNLVQQTVYLEPIETPILFALSRPVLVQGAFDYLEKDNYGALNFQRREFERITYRVLSDRYLPPVDLLRSSSESYPSEISNYYLQLPSRMDRRISDLAAEVTGNAGNRYDKAKALEVYLQNNFGYTLDLKASGDEPLADFLFNVREGHCEYFATAMAVMLRTQGVAARVVNGFQQGDYNETAGVYMVKQRNAHSWVEVFFPGENVWVQFDPTPFAGQTTGGATAGIAAQFNKYLEAFETMWIEYFVAYDDVGQRSLLRSVRDGFVDFQAKSSAWIDKTGAVIAEWWTQVRGDRGLQTSLIAIAYALGGLVALVAGILLLVWFYRRAVKWKIWKKVLDWLKRKNETAIVEFYSRMEKAMASRGLYRAPHQTPLEFAFALDMPEAVKITEKYNRVRFGEKGLTGNEADDIEAWLKDLENKFAK
jgi:protein-glutamine gamma-glutamyltransferase